MKSKAMIPLVLGLVIGLAALKLGMDAVHKAEGGQTASPETEVVVAAVDIGATMEVRPDAVVVKKTVSTPLLPSDAFGKIEDVVGRVTNKTIPAGTPLIPALLAPEGTVPGLQVTIPEGYRAVSVKITEVTGVAYQLVPGSFVDVLVVMDVKSARGKKQTMSRVILQNIAVAAVGQVRGDVAETESGRSGSIPAKSITLLVPVEDVPKLHLAQTKGKITLAMRGGDDELLADVDNVWEDVLLGRKDPQETSDPGTTPAAGSIKSAIAEQLFVEAPPAHPPFTCTVINGPLGANTAGQVLRITYADAHSMEVVEVGKGRTTGDTNSMRFGTEENPSPSRGYNLFGDRDRTARRRGAQIGAMTLGSDNEDEDDSSKETSE